MSDVKLEDLIDAALPPDKIEVFIWFEQKWVPVGNGTFFDPLGTPTKVPEARAAARKRLEMAMNADREVTFRQFFKARFKPPTKGGKA